jgi:acyl carrier protein
VAGGGLDKAQFLDDVTFNRGAMEMLDVVERTKAIVIEQLAVDPDAVIETASFMEDLGADSLDMVELAIKFEQEFGFEISDEATEFLLTVGDAIKFLEANAFS